MLLRLDCLMQTIGITTPRHDTSGKLIDDQNLIIFYNIVLIAVHQVVCTQCENDVVLDLQILRICKVLNMEIFLDLAHTFLRQVYNLILLIDDEVTGLLDVFAHDCIHLCELAGSLALLELMSQNVTDLIQLRGLTALTGNDQRSSRLIDQDRVNLIDDRILKTS